MNPPKTREHSRTSEKVQVIAMNADEQARRTDEAIARRAYEIFESRGSAAWHELEDWRQAESELVKPLCHGRMPMDDTLWVGADASIFEQGTIEIWVAARRLTICGTPRIKGQGAVPTQSRSGGIEKILRVADLPFEIDPSNVTTKFSGQSLEILLKKAEPEHKARATAA